MINFNDLVDERFKSEVDKQNYIDKQPNIFRIDYEMGYTNNRGREVKQMKSCYVMGYTIESCREMVVDSCFPNSCEIWSESRVCERVDGITKEVMEMIFRVNNVNPPKQEVKPKSMMKLSSVDDNSSIDLGSKKVNLSRVRVDLPKDKKE